MAVQATCPWDLPAVDTIREVVLDKQINARMVYDYMIHGLLNCRQPSPRHVDGKAAPLARSQSHMDLVQPVKPGFTGVQSVSTEDISRLRSTNTNLINGFYTVSIISYEQHGYVLLQEPAQSGGQFRYLDQM